MRTDTVEKNISAEEGKLKNKAPVGKNKRAIMFIIISAVVFCVFLVADLVTKSLAVEYLELGISKQIIPGVLYFTLTYNSGMAFGIFSGTTAGMIVVTIFTVVVMAAIVVVFIKTGKSRGALKIILAVIEAGAIGNFVDRIMMFSGNLSGVRDFLDISSVKFFGKFNFGICNLADFWVSLGGVALVIYMIYFIATEDKDKKEKAEAVPPEKVDKDAILAEDYKEKDVSDLEEVENVFSENADGLSEQSDKGKNG